MATPPNSAPRLKKLGLRDRFFGALKNKHSNVYAIYLMVSFILIWSGCWYIGDTWAQGKDLLALGPAFSLGIVGRHLAILLGGLAILYSDDQSLQELILMKVSPPPASQILKSPWKRFFARLHQRYPNWMAIYIYFGIIFSWCGTWGLIWDIPVHPLWRSLITIHLGFFMLYIDDFKLTEI